MARVKLHETCANGSTPVAAPVHLNPLRVTGVIVTKAALLEALRTWVPTVADVACTEDGETFLLYVEDGDGGQAEG